MYKDTILKLRTTEAINKKFSYLKNEIAQITFWWRAVIRYLFKILQF